MAIRVIRTEEDPVLRKMQWALVLQHRRSAS